MNTEKFKSLLDEKYEWPCHYTFKFVVNTTSENELASFFETDQVEKKSSRTGKYISFTVKKEMHSSDDVIAVYTEVSKVEGIVSL